MFNQSNPGCNIPSAVGVGPGGFGFGGMGVSQVAMDATQTGSVGTPAWAATLFRRLETAEASMQSMQDKYSKLEKSHTLLTMHSRNALRRMKPEVETAARVQPSAPKRICRDQFLAKLKYVSFVSCIENLLTIYSRAKFTIYPWIL